MTRDKATCSYRTSIRAALGIGFLATSAVACDPSTEGPDAVHAAEDDGVELDLAPSQPAPGGGFEFGVAAGDVDSHSAILWAKATRSGMVWLQLSGHGPFRDCGMAAAASQRVLAAQERDNTVQRRVTGLAPSTRYRYRFCDAHGAASETGEFTTAPDAASPRTIRFAVAGDQDARPSPGQQQPHWSTFDIWDRIRAQGNDFNVLLGDAIYSDTEIPGHENADFARTLAQKRDLYKLALGLGPWARARGAAAYYGGWDDHEFINDFAPGHDVFEAAGPVGDPEADPVEFPPILMDGRELFRRGSQAFREYNPVTHREATGLYRSVRWGKNLEIFFLDERSFRSNEAHYEGACDNPPGSGVRDPVPTAPQALRDAFSVFLPQLAMPVPAECLAAIHDPRRTLLGAAQLARFKREVASSTATFKVVLAHGPIHAFYIDPYDRWEGYPAERDELLHFLRDNVENVVFFSHSSSMVNNARFTTTAGPEDSGILDVTVGSVAAATFGDEIATELRSASGGALVHDLIFKPPPPDGVAMQCAAIDQPAYAQVEVSSDRLTIDLLDPENQPVRDTGDSSTPGGPPCERITVVKRP